MRHRADKIPALQTEREEQANCANMYSANVLGWCKFWAFFALVLRVLL